MTLNGQRVVILGGTSGIGLARPKRQLSKVHP